MSEVKAKLKYARVGAQKARHVVNLVRGKNVDEAIKILTITDKKSAELVKKLIESAVANAEQKKVIDVDRLFVKHISVDQGPMLKRFKPRAQGRASAFNKKTSHINVILGER